ncbi:unnamed protein product [Tilletia controversa]|nr:unnamed protein product [Tilletia controversa]CAD6914617.1 unnamed protein product [Tilletia controversa]CAD6968110.1 unnamed protein product [Tilletia controversa]CAD6976471.1 unnamed protein product [Tilletia controversa]
MDTISGDVWLREWAKWIRLNEAKLSDAPPHAHHHPHAGTNTGLGSWLGLGLGSIMGGSQSAAEQQRQQQRTRTLSTPLRNGPPQSRTGAVTTSGAGAGGGSQPLALRLNVHYLYYILLRADAISLPVGPLDVRIPGAVTGSNGGQRPNSYFSLLSARREEKKRAGGEDDNSDAVSVKSTFSLAPSTWWGLGGGSTTGSGGATLEDPDRDLKYIYSALTKIPSLRLEPPPLPTTQGNSSTSLIRNHEENCPGTYAVPLDLFKNVHVLETVDVDPRTLLGWDRLSIQLRSLTVNRSGVEDVTDLLVDKVVDDAQRRKGVRVRDRKRKVHAPEGAELSPVSDEEEESESKAGGGAENDAQPTGTGTGALEDSGSLLPSQAAAKAAASAPLPTDALPSLAWHFLRYLSLADNALTFLPSAPLLALSGLTHLDLSSNLLNSVPPALAALPSLAVLNLSTNLLESVLGIYTLIPHIRVLNLSHNRLDSLCGLERLSALRRIDLRHNELYDVGEIGRLVDCAKLAEVWVGTGNIGLFEERPDWRVDCFVLFEQEGRFGLKIDGEGPGWLERGRIRERVPQTAKWKQAKAAADKEAEAKVAAAAAAAAKVDQKGKGKGKGKVGNGAQGEELEAAVIGPTAAIQVAASRRAAGRTGTSMGGTRLRVATADGGNSLSPPRVQPRSRRPTSSSLLTDIDAGADDEEDEGGGGGGPLDVLRLSGARATSPSGRSHRSAAGGGRRGGGPRRRESDASSTGGFAARLLAERQQASASGPRRRNRRLIDLENNAGAGGGGVASMNLLAGQPEGKPASTASLFSSSGVIGLAAAEERDSSPASIAVASRLGSVLPDPPADHRSGLGMSRTSTVSSAAIPPLSNSVIDQEALSAAESDFSAMSDSEAIKRAVLQGRNDLAASPYVTAGPDGAPTENRPPPAWMNSVGRKSGAGARLGSMAVSQAVLSPAESGSAGEGAGSGGGGGGGGFLSSPGTPGGQFGSSPNLVDDEVERAAQRQRRLSHAAKTGGRSLAPPPSGSPRPTFNRHDSTNSTGGGISAPPGLAVPADVLAADPGLLSPSRGSPRNNDHQGRLPPSPLTPRRTQHGRSSSHQRSPPVAGAGPGGDVASLSRISGSAARARPNADQIQSRRSRVSLSMYDPPSPIGGPAGGVSAGLPQVGTGLPAGGTAGMDASDAFRRRIEALKGEVGDDWLRLMVARNEQAQSQSQGQAQPDLGRRGSAATGAGLVPRVRKLSNGTKASRKAGAGAGAGAGTGRKEEEGSRKPQQQQHKAAVVDVNRGDRDSQRQEG